MVGPTPRELAQRFVPVSPREQAMVKRCHLLMPYQEGVNQDDVACPCSSPHECHLAAKQLLREPLSKALPSSNNRTGKLPPSLR